MSSSTRMALASPLAIRTAAAAAALTLVVPTARAQGALIQGVVDAEWWATSGESTLLTRNANRGGMAGRLSLWTAVEPRRGFVVYAQGQLLGGPASVEAE